MQGSADCVAHHGRSGKWYCKDHLPLAIPPHHRAAEMGRATEIGLPVVRPASQGLPCF